MRGGFGHKRCAVGPEIVGVNQCRRVCCVVGFTKYIHGNPITNLVNRGVSPSPAGFDFILDGPDAGKVILGELGATRDNSLGRDLLLVDPDTGGFQQIYQFSTNSNAYAVSVTRRARTGARPSDRCGNRT